MTKYLVLREIRPDEVALEPGEPTADPPGPIEAETSLGWQIIGTVETHGPIEAIKAIAADKDTGGDGLYVAVPVRNWNPEPVTIETKVDVKVGS